MPRVARLLLAAGAFAALPLASAAAQSAATDSLAFPRQFVKWASSGQGDSAYSHAGAELRESMQSAAQVSAMASRIATRFGEMQGTDAEVQFDEGALKVYIAAVRFAQAPQPAAWVVVYSPSTKVVERATFGPLASAKGRYPQAKLP
jgi:hypothetical protein